MGLNIGTGRDPVIGIVGHGFVGKAIARVFMEHGHVQIYDVLPGKSPSTFEQAVCSDIVFICVPTPMTDPENGNFAPDMSYVHGVFKQIKDTVRFHHHPVYVIKSTVCVGETEKIATEYEIDNVVHSPEFLTARGTPGC